jgi:phosphosulfolactate synthase
MLSDSTKARVDSKKPRQEGLTYTIDKLEALDRENIEIISPLIDLVKIYGAFPLLIPDSILKKKIQFYHDQNILVSTGSSITEYAYAKGHFNKFVEEASKIGFDVIEIGENSIDLNLEQKEKIVSTIRSYDLQYHWKVGKKDPRHQLRTDQILEKIEELFACVK